MDGIEGQQNHLRLACILCAVQCLLRCDDPLIDCPGEGCVVLLAGDDHGAQDSTQHASWRHPR